MNGVGLKAILFKLELDSRIKKIPRPVFNEDQPRVQVPVPVPVPDPDPGPAPAPIPVQDNTIFFVSESNRETDKNEALADDNTVITIFERESLSAVKEILDNFSILSGLKCNTAKTVILPTFDVDENDRALVQELGFKITDSFTLLGVNISRKLDNIREIFIALKNKIINIVSFWERFRLSLPGRLTILKTCLISQLCYIGCFLPPPDDILLNIQEILNNFL